MSWRPYTDADKPSVDALHIQMETRLGRTLDMPDLGKRPMLIGMVYDNDGVVTHAVALEAEAEVMALGETPLASKEWDYAATVLTQVCCAYRIRIVRSFIPSECLGVSPKLSPIERMLKHFGFVREDHSKMVQFSKWLG